MHIIGIVGGVAGGKSLVARQLSDLGATVLEADRIGHEVLRREDIEAAARERWGDGVFGPDGRIDRRRLAKIVFAPSPHGSREREHLENLTHPEIGRLIRQEISRLASDGQELVVLDAPLLMEAGWDDFCNTIIFVDTPWAVRLARAKLRGWSEEDFVAREDAQDSLDSKRKRADVTIDNSQSVESTKAQIERWRHSLVV
jgi:dephospho-CoA kinase